MTRPYLNPNQPPLIDMPPDPFVRQFAAGLALEQEVSLDVLDVGCGTGRHSRYFAQLGHNAVGFDNDLNAIQDAVRFARQANVTSTNHYAVGSITNLPTAKLFDVVLVNEVLNYIPKISSRNVLTEADKLTKPGGYNLVSGYLLDSTVRGVANLARCFEPGELESTYADWRIIDWELIESPVSFFRNKEYINSRVKMLAQKIH